MDLKPIRAGLGRLIAALVSLAFILTPMASALHLDAAPQTVCEVESGGDHAGDQDAGQHNHADHAHGCGACHFHLIGHAGLPVSAMFAPRSVLRPVLTYDIGASLPGGLYRPPRG